MPNKIFPDANLHTRVANQQAERCPGAGRADRGDRGWPIGWEYIVLEMTGVVVKRSFKQPSAPAAEPAHEE